MRFAFLGAGGMGKTAAVLHILHHRDVVNHYKDNRHFVCCDAVTSAETLAELILRFLQVPAMHEENIVDLMHGTLLQMPPVLLVLDNFETLWDVASIRTGVSDLLQKIANAKSVSLIITMRGAVPPPCIAWTNWHNLTPLFPRAAKKAFLAINPFFSDGDSDNDNSMKTLLEEMDYIPLAIRLLAQVSIGFSPQYMLKHWKEERTAMLQTGKGSLENIDVSISLSIAALIDNPGAVELLGLLCQLPDGLCQWDERLPHIGAGFQKDQNVHDLFRVLLRTALVFIGEDTVKVMSPIRHYVNRKHPLGQHHIHHLESYFWGLIHTHTTETALLSFSHARNILEVEMGNIRSLITNAARRPNPSIHVVDAALEISEFLHRTNPLTELLCEVLPLVKQIGCPIKKENVSWRLGKILHMHNRHAEISDTLKEAREKFFEIDDSVCGEQTPSRHIF